MSEPVLITGGAGFLGANLADRLAGQGHKVMVLDSLARPGVETNLAWLLERHGERIHPLIADIRNAAVMRDAVADARAVFHFAAQVAVTSSVADPAEDFEVNLRGTFDVLEACRAAPHQPPLLFASTNKVYGKIGDVTLVEQADSYLPEDGDIGRYGVPEGRPLQFWSPYGCSKGAADQYVLDYARIYGLRTTVLRMSCLYGPRQFGTEDQGWVAHFLISALAGEPITIYGDGKQVRDVLFVDDVVDAWATALDRIDELAGRAYNIGGGPANMVSLRQMLDAIGRLNGRRPEVRFDGWRPGDQLFYVSDIRAFGADTGWRPRVGVQEGLARLNDWLKANWRQIASIRRSPRDESSPGQSELELRRQHLLWMSRTASSP
jgi:CDP-paratose 2-epimerase